MAYSQKLEAKIDGAAKGWTGIAKKKMFGGVGWLLRGNMAFGIWKDCLIVRMDKEQAGQSMARKHVRPFDITGRPMAGWIMVEPEGWKNAANLAGWLAVARSFARSLPETQGKTKTKKKAKTLMQYRAGER